MSAAFEQLSPAMQYQIVNGLGFRGLRPIQERTIEAVLAGHNCVVLAPTAGGKTEAAFFPLLSQMDLLDWRPVSVIYVTPIRALLNNQEERLSRYAALIGRRVFKWHGDVGPAQRRAFLKDPADVLLTTPESLEVMLMSPNIPARRLMAGLRAVVIDEVHAFAGDDRGGHLSALLERLSRYCGQDVQRIGLSATVGNPAEILAWAAGSSRRQGQVVAVAGTAAAPELVLDYVGSEENAARVVGRLHPGKKRLVFVDSRRGVEAVGRALLGAGVSAFVTHSSLAAAERRRAEEAFAHGQDCVIVATSALELGIDIGDLDHVLQVDCPTTVAGFLQRLGRSGRREGTRANCTFLATDDEALVRSAALLRLHRAGYVEDVAPRRCAAHLFAHQVMALSRQEAGIPEGDIWGWIGPATAVAGLAEGDRREIIEHMVSEEILVRDGARLLLGPRGERLYGARHFLELYAVFSTPATFTVYWGAEEVGTVEAFFLEQTDPGALCFTLGARSWQATSIEWGRGVLQVQPATQGRAARWRGQMVVLHRALCQAMREVLVSEEEDERWSRRARERMKGIREEYGFLREAQTPLVPGQGGYRLWNFAGGKANNLLARTLEEILGERVGASNLYVSFGEGAGQSEVAIRQAMEALREAGRPDEGDALRLAEGCARGRLSKFQPCLTPRLEARYLASVLTELGDF